jgi:hypothetical protein
MKKDSPSNFDGKKVGAPMDAVSPRKAGVVRRDRSRRWNRVIEGDNHCGRMRTDAMDGVAVAVDDMRAFALIRKKRGRSVEDIAKSLRVSLKVVKALLDTASQELQEKVERREAERRNRPHVKAMYESLLRKKRKKQQQVGW